MAKKKLDNAHDLQRLKSEFPDVHGAFLAGKIPSLRKAFVIAGIKPERTRLDKLKNSWTKATDNERNAFLSWLAARGALSTTVTHSSGPSPSQRAAEAPIASGRYLLPSAIAEIKAIMAKRRLQPEDVMQEIGFPPDDRSLAHALARGASLRLAVIAALEAWLRTNARG
ncbi:MULTISPECIES: hypothetical protein [unclassified Sinorhizobium]|uniref:hypothetical protein n=1 Tax=unclassified Sinorhizobium TaxID=2613772 RepID=UPI0024C38AC8|nr:MULTISPECIES: hypothetical protein [unclassified Sinorhizobium]MDK1377222.1 hypothetical protein [Sinorhizobium sp. 6-70]MDK1478812.1 hypothetical protein [Sinorhizobium sp. 6-117]